MHGDDSLNWLEDRAAVSFKKQGVGNCRGVVYLHLVTSFTVAST